MPFLDKFFVTLGALPKNKRMMLMTAIGLSIFYFLIKYYRNTKLRVFFSSEKFAEFVKWAPSLKSGRFYPFPLLSSALAQCLLSKGKYLDDSDLVQTRDSFNYPNGGTGRIEWITLKSKEPKFNPKVIAFILPGLSSQSTASYLRDLYITLINQGIRPVVFVPRFNDDKLFLPDHGLLNLFDDIHAAVLYVKSKYPDAKLIGIGHSYGANAIVNYLGFHNTEKNFLAGISIANPYDFPKASALTRGTIIEKYLMTGIKEIVRNNLDTLTQHSERYKWSVEEMQRAKQLREFDNAFVAKIMGMKDADDYYDKISSEKRVWNVEVPLLSINAEDDPFVDFKGVPIDAHKKNKNLLFIVTKKGAHIGWVGGLFKLNRWYLSVVRDYITWITENS